MQAAGVDACVLVEAGVNQSAENDWFLQLAATHDHIAGVVGYLDLHGDPAAALSTIHPDHRQYLKGVRISIMDSAQDYAAELHNGLNFLAAQNLSCDLLIRNDPLPRVAELAAAHPDVTFILDHFAGTHMTADGFTDWKTALEPVAQHRNTVMKVSGYLTISDPMPPDIALLRPYFDIALKLFGPRRLMYGSDWPVCLRGGPYEAGVALLRELTALLTPDEQADIWGQTAYRIYHL
jgi:L-fuconolactonase